MPTQERERGSTIVMLAVLAAALGGCDGCGPDAPADDDGLSPSEHCGDPLYAAGNELLCFGGCKDPANLDELGCAPCVGNFGDPLCPAECDTDDCATSSSSSSSSSSSTDPSTTEPSTTESSTTDSTGSDSSSSDTTTGGTGELQIELIGRYQSGVFNQAAAKIAGFDPATQRVFVSNAAADTVDVLDLSDPTTPVFVEAIAIPGGGTPNHVEVRDGVVAVSVSNAAPQQPGELQFYDADGDPLATVIVGAVPDMFAFTPDGTRVVVANEGEPSANYSVDPEGSISIIDVSGGAALVTQGDVSTAGFGGFTLGDLDPDVRIFGPGAPTVAEDLEPESLAIAPDGTIAWVSLQENNAFAIVDLATATVTEIVALGSKDYDLAGQGFDPSDQDGAIAIAQWPVRGMYQPDGMAAIDDAGETLLVTVNEGDARVYVDYTEESRVAALTLDPVAFPGAAALQGLDQLGRLRVTATLGDIGNDGDYDELYAFGARSLAVWAADGTLVWDSGDLLEQTIADALPLDFNSDEDVNGSFDDRSDDKGPEPEPLAVAQVFDSTYAFVGCERVGGIVVFDLADPVAPVLVTYVNDRNFAGNPMAGTAGDLGPEGMIVVSAADSPNGNPLLVVAHDISGSVAVYELTQQ